jgi:hypothetical protein
MGHGWFRTSDLYQFANRKNQAHLRPKGYTGRRLLPVAPEVAGRSSSALSARVGYFDGGFCVRRADGQWDVAIIQRQAPGGLSLWGTKWGTKAHVAQPIPAKPNLAETA